MDEFHFTYEWYDRLLGSLREQEYNFSSFYQQIEPGTVFVRHDVDFSPKKAVRIAEIETDHGIKSTYFFRLSAPVYNVFNAGVRKSIGRIEELGHDIGVHFDSHQYWDRQPDDETLTATIRSEQEALATLTETCEIIAFHNPPEWVLGTVFDGIEHTYEPRFFEEIGYVADSNQRWRSQPPFPDGFPEQFQLLTHPVQWGETDRSKNAHLRELRSEQTAQVRAAIEEAMIDED